MKSILNKLFSKSHKERQTQLGEEVKQLEKELQIAKLEKELKDLEYEEIKIHDRVSKIFLEIMRLKNV